MAASESPAPTSWLRRARTPPEVGFVPFAGSGAAFIASETSARIGLPFGANRLQVASTLVRWPTNLRLLPTAKPPQLNSSSGGLGDDPSRESSVGFVQSS